MWYILVGWRAFIHVAVQQLRSFPSCSSTVLRPEIPLYAGRRKQEKMEEAQPLLGALGLEETHIPGHTVHSDTEMA